MYNVKDIAGYIINYSNENSSPVSNLKLQKILFYVQAYFMIKKNSPCFNEDFEHWRHGPVIPEIYSKYRMYFNNIITDRQENKINNNTDRTLINEVIKSYKDFTPWDMVRKTHGEDPWINTEENEVIDKEIIQEYFRTNEEKLLGAS